MKLLLSVMPQRVAGPIAKPLILLCQFLSARGSGAQTCATGILYSMRSGLDDELFWRRGNVALGTAYRSVVKRCVVQCATTISDVCHAKPPVLAPSRAQRLRAVPVDLGARFLTATRSPRCAPR